MIIWRGSGWLILPFFLLTWGIADRVIQPIYRWVTGYEFMYNADKAMCWAIAFGVVAALILGHVPLSGGVSQHRAGQSF